MIVYHFIDILRIQKIQEFKKLNINIKSKLEIFKVEKLWREKEV